MGLPEAPRPVSVGNCRGATTVSIGSVSVGLRGPSCYLAFSVGRGATTCFYWASKLPSGTFPAALKTLKTLPAALPWDFPRPHELFLLETAIWQCFCLGFAAAIWHFLLGEALQPVSIGLRNCHPARFQQQPLPFPRPQTVFLSVSVGFAAAIPRALQPVSRASSFAMGHGNFPRPHELFLLETAIWQCFCWASNCYLTFRYNLAIGLPAIRHVSSSP